MVRRITKTELGAPDVAVRFEHENSAPREARRALDPLLADEADDPIADAVRVVVSELVSNVVQHTIDGGTMQAWDPKPDVPFRLEVTDPDERDPESPPEATEHGGRGISIVEQLAAQWGVDHHSHGKTVWAEFNRSEPDED